MSWQGQIKWFGGPFTFPIPGLLGNHFTCISYISHILWAERGSGSLFSRIFSKEFCILNNCGRYYVSSRGRQVCLPSGILVFSSDLQKLGRFAWILYKRFRYPKLGVPQLWCKPTECSGTHLGHFALLPWDLWGKGNWQEHEAHAACTVKVVWLWSRSLMSFARIHEMLAG